MNLKKLSAKFPEQEIEWRVQQCGTGKKGPWALIIPYITSRAIMSRLDDVVGPGNWKNEYTSSPCGKGYLCGISIKIEGDWVTRWDGSELSESNNIDDVKSTLSNSMKRAGVQWGIGRYLYQLEATFADAQFCDSRYDTLPGYQYQKSKNKEGVWFGFQWKPKPLESWALPVSEKETKKLIKNMKSAKSEKELKSLFETAYKIAVSEGDDDLMDEFTKAKDESKERIATELEKDNNEKGVILEGAISSKIAIFDKATNESALSGLSKAAMKDIEKHCSGERLKYAKSKIQKATTEKLNQLRGK